MSHKSFALKLNSSWIGGVTQQQLMAQPNVVAKAVAGSPYPMQSNIHGISGGFRFTSFNVATALGILGWTGLVLGSGVTAELWEIQWDDVGNMKSGSVHRKCAIAVGRAIWRTIRASHRNDAMIDIEVFALSSDGSTSPFAWTESQALPTAVDDARHTLYSCKLGDIDMGCHTDLTIDSGWQIQADACKSNVWDTRLKVAEITPKISVTTLNTELVGSSAGKINIQGIAATHANTLIQLRKRIPLLSTFVANITEEHISITSAGTVVPSTPYTGQANEDGTSSFDLHSYYDGTNTPFVIDATAALA